MNTMNTQFKEQVQAHIIECLSTDTTEVLAEQLQNAVNEFTSWYGPYEQKRKPNRQEAFQDFLMCLPSCLSVEYMYYASNEVLKWWFENCGMQYKQPKHLEKAHATYLHLIYREFRTLCKKNGVTF